MNSYPYVDMTRANANGTFPVYIIVKNGRGRFFVNTGMTTCGRLSGLQFPPKDRNWKQKTTALGKMLADVERVCLQQQVAEWDNMELKAHIQREVFGVERKAKAARLCELIAEFAKTKRESTRVLYGITARKVEAYDARATLESVDASWLEHFREECLGSGMKVNGAGKELRNVRAVFNWARRRGLTKNYPFGGYSIAEEETRPNNISVEQLRRLRDYACEPWQERYRDFFMLSFYLAGMNPVDLLTCRAEAVRDGHLTFVRQKTNKEGQKKVRTTTLPVVGEAQAIIDRYKSGEGWLLSFMDGREDYHSFVKKANAALKKIGTSEKVADRTGRLRKVLYHPILPDITMYTARYTFGSIAANDLDISERTIGLCLGHSWSKAVTSRYISNDQRRIDMAVRRVVEYVGGSESYGDGLCGSENL